MRVVDLVAPANRSKAVVSGNELSKATRASQLPRSSSGRGGSIDASNVPVASWVGMTSTNGSQTTCGLVRRRAPRGVLPGSLACLASRS